MFIIRYEDHSGPPPLPPHTHTSWNIVYVLNCFKMCVCVCAYVCWEGGQTLDMSLCLGSVFEKLSFNSDDRELAR